MNERLLIRVIHRNAADADRICSLVRACGHESERGSEAGIWTPGPLGDVHAFFVESELLQQSDERPAAEVVVALTSDTDGAPSASAADATLFEQVPVSVGRERLAGVLAKVAVVRAIGRSMRQQVQGLRDELAQARLEYELFAGRISHHVQGALQNIDGFAAAVQHRGAERLDDKDQHYLDRIRRNAARGNSLIADLLHYYRLASSPLEITQAELHLVLRNVQQRLAAAFPSDRYRLILPERGSRMRADPSLLEHAIHALLANAVKFTREASRRDITVNVRRVAATCEITVADTGIGFDPAEAHRLFQPFSRLHDVERFEGNGMGLAIARRIAERHGGSVRAEGGPGAGACFTLVFPFDPEVQAADAPANAPLSRPPGRDGLRVLLVDDDALVLSAVTNMLERAGCQVTPAPNGQQALTAFELALRNVAFDVVVTDWGMPQIGGQRVAEAVKRVSPSTPVVVLTGLTPAVIRSELQTVDAIMTKPVRLAQLRQTLETVAHRRA